MNIKHVILFSTSCSLNQSKNMLPGWLLRRDKRFFFCKFKTNYNFITLSKRFHACALVKKQNLIFQKIGFLFIFFPIKKKKKFIKGFPCFLKIHKSLDFFLFFLQLNIKINLYRDFLSFEIRFQKIGFLCIIFSQ